MTEINKDFYCSAIAHTPTEHCSIGLGTKYDNLCTPDVECGCYNHKWPTPEQFEAEYGFPVPMDMPVWVDYNGWTLCTFRKSFDLECGVIVVSCTPWGKPDDSWRPE